MSTIDRGYLFGSFAAFHVAFMVGIAAIRHVAAMVGAMLGSAFVGGIAFVMGAMFRAAAFSGFGLMMRAMFAAASMGGGCRIACAVLGANLVFLVFMVRAMFSAVVFGYGFVSAVHFAFFAFFSFVFGAVFDAIMFCGSVMFGAVFRCDCRFFGFRGCNGRGRGLSRRSDYGRFHIGFNGFLSFAAG